LLTSGAPQRVGVLITNTPQRVEVLITNTPQRVEVLITNTPQRVGVLITNTPQRVGVLITNTPQRVGVLITNTPQRVGVLITNTPQRVGVLINGAPQKVPRAQSSARRQRECEEQQALQEGSTALATRIHPCWAWNSTRPSIPLRSKCRWKHGGSLARQTASEVQKSLLQSGIMFVRKENRRKQTSNKNVGSWGYRCTNCKMSTTND
jgi:hypothetical protein